MSLNVIDLEIADQILKVPLVVLIELSFENGAHVGDHVDRDFCLGQVSLDLSRDHVWLKSKFLPRNRSELVEDDGKMVVNGGGRFFLDIFGHLLHLET